MRFEKKFVVEKNFRNIIKVFLKEKQFFTQYPPRIVNSIYYDCNSFRRFSESEDGISKRSKCRIRFYNQDNEKLILEFKNKDSELGWKRNSSINKYQKNFREYKLKNCKNKIVKVSIPNLINNEDSPSLFVSYLRDYYISHDGLLRLTIDSNMSFGKLRIGNLIRITRIFEKFFFDKYFGMFNLICLEKI